MQNDSEKEGYEDLPYAWMDEGDEMGPGAFIWGVVAIVAVFIAMLAFLVFS